MRIQLVAPFRCHFNVINHQILANEDKYHQLWQRIGQTVPAALGKYPLIRAVEFLHSQAAPTGMRYQKLHESGSLLPPEVLRVRPAPETVPLMQQAVHQAEDALTGAARKGALTPHFETLLFRLYDNTLGLAEVALEIGATHWQDDGEQVCADIQAWSNAFMRHLIPAYYRAALFPLVIDLWRLDRAGEYIETPGAYHGYPEVTLLGKKPPTAAAPDYHPDVAGQPLWVSRSLFVDGLDLPRRRAILRHWVTTADPSFGGESEFVFLGWGHNVFNAPVGSALAREGQEALLLGQYFYTVLESVNLSLTRFMGVSLGRLSRGETRQLDHVMEDVVVSVNLLVTQFNDTQQNLQGHRQAFFKDLRSRWSMDTLLHNVEKKIGAVTGQINRIYEKSVKTSQLLIQLILCAIGGIALVSFCLSLSQYARTAVAPPEQGPAADGVWGLLDVAAAAPPDAVIWGGIVVLTALLGLFWLFQRRGR